MTVPATSDGTAARHGHANPDDFWVVCLCAEWCHVCRDWQPRFQPWWPNRVGCRTLWLDVEDEKRCPNLDIETFPTLLILRRNQPLFLGAVPPVDEHIARLVKNAHSRVRLPHLHSERTDLGRTRLEPLHLQARIAAFDTQEEWQSGRLHRS